MPFIDIRRALRTVLAAALALGSLPHPATAQELTLSKPGTRVALSPAFSPPLLKGLKINPANPFRLEFILDPGVSSESEGEPSFEGEASFEALAEKPSAKKSRLKAASSKLIKYFLASLTVPEKDLWVNLSPYEKYRIVPDAFGKTEMGRDLLAQDYLLKQLTASLLYPEGETGRKYWNNVYAAAAKKYGGTQVAVNTFNKVWIMPDKAVVYENAKAGTAYVVESRLKVMLEQDYVATQRNRSGEGAQRIEPQDHPAGSHLTQTILREIIIPQLTKEVNEGKNFAQLRQVYNSLILANWYKKKIKDSILARVYADKNKIEGLLPTGGQVPTKSTQNVSASRAAPLDVDAIYRSYLEAFKMGVYNYIKEDIDPATHQPVPRKYFSGGMSLQFGDGVDSAMTVTQVLAAVPRALGKLLRMDVDVVPFGESQPVPKLRPRAFSPTEIDNLLTRALTHIETAYQGDERVKWRGAYDAAKFILGHYSPVNITRDHILVGMETLDAIALMSWVSKDPRQRNMLRASQRMFAAERNAARERVAAWARGKYRATYHRMPDNIAIIQGYATDGTIARHGQSLVEAQLKESLYNLDRWGYAGKFVNYERDGYKLVKAGAVNAAIVGNQHRDRFGLARYAAAPDTGVNVIVVPPHGVVTTGAVQGRTRAVLRSGFIFQNGQPYFAEFAEPLPVDYAVNLDARMAPLWEETGTPTAGHRLSTDYLEEKDITMQIAAGQGLNVPRTRLFLSHVSLSEAVFKRRQQGHAVSNVMGYAYRQGKLHQRVQEELREFLAGTPGGRGVIKPNRGSGGRGIFFFNDTNIPAAATHVLALLPDNNVLVQERIVPPPLVESGVRQDWNVRVFVTGDHQGKARIKGLVVRFGPDGSVINASRGASWAAFKDAAGRLGLEAGRSMQLKRDIEAAAGAIFEAIPHAMMEDKVLNPGEPAVDFMGVDIIVDEHLKPYVMEANGLRTGGGWAFDRVASSEERGLWAGGFIETMRRRGLAYRASLGRVDGAMMSAARSDKPESISLADGVKQALEQKRKAGAHPLYAAQLQVIDETGAEPADRDRSWDVWLWTMMREAADLLPPNHAREIKDVRLIVRERSLYQGEAYLDQGRVDLNRIPGVPYAALKGTFLHEAGHFVLHQGGEALLRQWQSFLDRRLPGVLRFIVGRPMAASVYVLGLGGMYERLAKGKDAWLVEAFAINYARYVDPARREIMAKAPAWTMGRIAYGFFERSYPEIAAWQETTKAAPLKPRADADPAWKSPLPGYDDVGNPVRSDRAMTTLLEDIRNSPQAVALTLAQEFFRKLIGKGVERRQDLKDAAARLSAEQLSLLRSVVKDRLNIVPFAFLDVLFPDSLGENQKVISVRDSDGKDRPTPYHFVVWDPEDTQAAPAMAETLDRLTALAFTGEPGRHPDAPVWRKVLARRNVRVLTVQDEQQVVRGFVVYGPKIQFQEFIEEFSGEAYYMAFDPAVQRQGLGTALLDKALGDFHALGITYVLINPVTEKSRELIRKYVRPGYEKVQNLGTIGIQLSSRASAFAGRLERFLRTVPDGSKVTAWQMQRATGILESAVTQAMQRFPQVTSAGAASWYVRRAVAPDADSAMIAREGDHAAGKSDKAMSAAVPAGPLVIQGVPITSPRVQAYMQRLQAGGNVSVSFGVAQPVLARQIMAVLTQLSLDGRIRQPAQGPLMSWVMVSLIAQTFAEKDPHLAQFGIISLVKGIMGGSTSARQQLEDGLLNNLPDEQRDVAAQALFAMADQGNEEAALALAIMSKRDPAIADRLSPLAASTMLKLTMGAYAWEPDMGVVIRLAAKRSRPALASMAVRVLEEAAKRGSRRSGYYFVRNAGTYAPYSAAARRIYGDREALRRLIRRMKYTLHANQPIKRAEVLRGWLAGISPAIIQWAQHDGTEGLDAWLDRYFKYKELGILKPLAWPATVRDEIVRNRLALAERQPRRDNRPLAVVIASHDDWNGSFLHSGVVEELLGRYRVLYFETATAPGMVKAIRAASWDGPIDALVISAHGTKDELVLGKGKIQGGIWVGRNEHLLEAHLDKLMAPDGIVVLDSCGTGGGCQDRNVARVMVNAFKRPVLAARGDLIFRGFIWDKNRIAGLLNLQGDHVRRESHWFNPSGMRRQAAAQKRRADVRSDLPEADSAMTAQLPKNTGGIDLTSTAVASYAAAGGGVVQFQLDAAQVARLRAARGFQPVIIHMQPLGDLRTFLGANAEDGHARVPTG